MMPASHRIGGADGLPALTISSWAARRLALRKAPMVRVGQTWLLWVGSRLALLIATFLLVIGWFATLALGFAVQTAFIRAASLLCVVTAFTGIAAGALLNSMVAMRATNSARR